MYVKNCVFTLYCCSFALQSFHLLKNVPPITKTPPNHGTNAYVFSLEFFPLLILCCAAHSIHAYTIFHWYLRNMSQPDDR